MTTFAQMRDEYIEYLNGVARGYLRLARQAKAEGRAAGVVQGLVLTAKSFHQRVREMAR